MKKIELLLAVVVFLPVSSQVSSAQVSSGCTSCYKHLHSDPWQCIQPPGCPGGCACIIVEGQFSTCSRCGCCTYIPGQGGVCIDESGDQCARIPCNKGMIAPQSVDQKTSAGTSHPVAGSDKTRDQLIEESPWLGNSDFEKKIEELSPNLGHVVQSLQDMLKNKNWLPAREGRTVESKISLRYNLTAVFSVTKAGSTWRLDLAPDPDLASNADIEEVQGANAANALEIIGRKWRVIHHGHPEKADVVLSSGTY
jgi:hypothetical protein